MLEAPARPVIPEMPERDTREEICLQAVATEDSTTASSESMTPAASCCIAEACVSYSCVWA